MRVSPKSVMMKITLLLVALLGVPCALAARQAPLCSKVTTNGWTQLIRTGESVGSSAPLGTILDSKMQTITVVSAFKHDSHHDLDIINMDFSIAEWCS